MKTLTTQTSNKLHYLLTYSTFRKTKFLKALNLKVFYDWHVPIYLMIWQKLVPCFRLALLKWITIYRHKFMLETYLAAVPIYDQLNLKRCILRNTPWANSEHITLFIEAQWINKFIRITFINNLDRISMEIRYLD